MSGLISHLRRILHSVAQTVGLRPIVASRIARFSLLTAVSGFDNKRSKSGDNSTSKWVYGDDACFISRTKNSCVLGVADGVGGWRAYGFDPGRFSRAVMKNCERLVCSGRFNPERPDLLIAQSYEDVLTLKDPILGSATLCVICLHKSQHRIYTASLGDSGYMLVRQGRVVQRSEHQKHTFNTPFQLACVPNNHSPHFHRDLPTQATQTTIDVLLGDLLIVGTDGLFDNLTDDVILQEVACIHSTDVDALEQLRRCARCLVDKARKAAFTTDSKTPFASEARRYGFNVTGGVPCDITVILGLVMDEDVLSVIEMNEPRVPRRPVEVPTASCPPPPSPLVETAACLSFSCDSLLLLCDTLNCYLDSGPARFGRTRSLSH